MSENKLKNCWIRNVFIDGEEIDWRKVHIKTSSYKRFQGDDLQTSITLEFETKEGGEGGD
jgi:hypothetical protein